ncbi:iron chaperone [Listeria kieliensis]|uniref:Iron chaperone n=1 Tax=Listeria kieliensis TaxID=1621700 RepID=A0A3D8TPK5_9LIST|nr:iron chaperone [Listeria kieliensis]RDX00637.1 iron chaperone [Listeria kieliensis]
METLTEYLDTLEMPEQRERMVEIFDWMKETFPSLVPVIKWNQPMFTDHGTFIIGFSTSKKHIAVAPEVKTMKEFEEKIADAGYSATSNLFRITWKQPTNFDLLKEIIEFNVTDKQDYAKFWREA